MRGDEKRVVDAFTAHLVREGWSVELEVEFCDVVARREDETIYAEVKGRTAAIGLDVDTMFGQLLRRMKEQPAAGDQYAVVLPSEAKTAVLRVPARVRAALGVRVFLVSADGDVAEL